MAQRVMAPRELDRIRRLALALPEVNERLSHGAPCFFVRDRRPLCYFHEAGFHDEGSRVALWCPAGDGVAEELVAADPDRFFRPTPSGSGVFADWLGIYLDRTDDGHPVDWREVGALLEDAYRTVAPKKLVAQLDGDGGALAGPNRDR